MTVYNKFKLAILTAIATQSLHAITIDSIQIQSLPGELLYAELPFHNAEPNQNIQASLASAQDLIAMGAMHQPPGHLNFFTRKSNLGSGVITITSNRPMTEAELNIIIKIQTGSSSHLQHIRQPLQQVSNQPVNHKANEQALVPVIIRNEQDIGLNLPISTQYQAKNMPAAMQRTETLLNVRHALPPILKTELQPAPITIVTAPTRPEPVPATPPTVAVDVTPLQKTSTTINVTEESTARDPLARQYAAQLAATKQSPAVAQEISSTPATSKIVEPQAEPTQAAATNNQHKVQANESLWKIASGIARQQNRSVNQVMDDIKNNNRHAFIQGDINRLRLGATLNLQTQSTTKSAQKQTTTIAKTQQNQAPVKTKYRLNQAEMSLVAEQKQDSNHNSANQNTLNPKTSKELSLKVVTAREKTVKLQGNVTQLELALNQKDQRIQVLNARLAQLQQQLKAQQAGKKPN